ncbi:MAG: hypothetical protein IT379_41735 [Deltaproteobacteria bacterium]|nr:hypothetical protein [Deltaproteobacteria bacterium]
MTREYVRPTVAGWLTPTLLAPWISVYGAITAYVLLGFDLGGNLGKAIAWGTGMLVGSVWAAVFCTFLVVTDLALLGVKVRTLPAGRRGWLTALLAPLPALGVYALLPWKTLVTGGPWTLAAAILIPMIAVAIGSRVIAGQKPPV